MNTNVVYGNAGENVMLIADYGNVLIVENSRGLKFPVKTEMVTDTENSKSISEELPEARHAPVRQNKKKVSPNEQSSLFD